MARVISIKLVDSVNDKVTDHLEGQVVIEDNKVKEAKILGGGNNNGDALDQMFIASTAFQNAILPHAARVITTLVFNNGSIATLSIPDNPKPVLARDLEFAKLVLFQDHVQAVTKAREDLKAATPQPASPLGN